MKTFKDTESGTVYAFNDDVVRAPDGSFHGPAPAGSKPGTLGIRLNVPATLVPYTVPPPTTAELAAEALAGAKERVTRAYEAAAHAPIDFTTAAGVTASFQADQTSLRRMVEVLAAFPTALSKGFYWVAADNTQVPFTRADLAALAKAIATRGFDAFVVLQNQKSRARKAAAAGDLKTLESIGK